MMRSDTTVNKVVFKEVPVEVEKIEEEIVWKDRRVEVQVPVEKVVERERVVYNDVVEYRDKVVYKDHIGAPLPSIRPISTSAQVCLLCFPDAMRRLNPIGAALWRDMSLSSGSHNNPISK